MAQDFQRKLHSTGGNLCLPKCFWYLADWIWDKHRNAKTGNQKKSPAEITLIQGSYNTWIKIKEKK